MKLVWSMTVSAALVAVSDTHHAHASIRLESIDVGEATYGIPLGISGNGQTVAGVAGTNQRAFTWSSLDASISLLSTDFASPAARATSYDGNVVGVNSGETSAYRYGDGAFTYLGPSIDIKFCSANGGVLAGIGRNAGWQWSESRGYELLSNFLPYGGLPNGEQLVGTSSGRAAIRDANGNVTLLSQVGPPDSSNRAEDISSDGRVVVGTGSGLVYRWFDGLPTQLPPVNGSEAAWMSVGGMSADGNVIVGRFSGAGNGAWLWTPALGTVNLRTYLQSRGVNVSGFAFTEATDVSDDGLSITGWYGVAFPYYLHFDSLSVPTPSSVTLVALASVISTSRRRR